MLIVNNRVIDKDILSILYDIQGSCHNGKLSSIEDRGEEIRVSCPRHSDGKEKVPACFIRKDDGVFKIC